MTRARRTTTALLVVPVVLVPVVLALGGCSISTTTSAAPVSVAPTPSETPQPELDLQLRPVLDIATATAGQCGETRPPTPDPAQPARLCSEDRTLLLSLGPAAVSGARVTGIEATMTSRQPQLQIKLDAQGGASLTRVTSEGMLLPEPRNQLALVSHGRVQAAPIITETVDGNVLVLTGFASVDDAAAARDLILAPPASPSPSPSS
jgi:preprotein translocase subunit SecD